MSNRWTPFPHWTIELASIESARRSAQFIANDLFEGRTFGPAELCEKVRLDFVDGADDQRAIFKIMSASKTKECVKVMVKRSLSDKEKKEAHLMALALMHFYAEGRPTCLITNPENKDAVDKFCTAFIETISSSYSLV